MSNRTLLLLFLLLTTAHARAQTSAPAVDPAMCDQLAGMPNAPMSVASCRKMMGMAADDPAAHRPGDDAMSCAQIFDELQANQPQGVSAEEAARQEALIQQGTTMNERHAARNARDTAPEAASLVAASALPAPLAAPIVAATEVSLAAKRKVATKAYMTEVHEVTGGAADIVDQRFGQNPRLKRLSQLAAAKQCAGPGR